MLPTVAQVLELEPVRRGQPRVVAGQQRLATPVRWVHAIELADAARLLRGGELVLTTGIALPAADDRLAAYLRDLAGIGVSAVAVELGRRYRGGLPPALVAEAEACQLPLVMFEREIPFIEITEAVHALILDDQLAQLRAANRLHGVFTELAVAGAALDEIVRQAALLAGRPVILEDLSHHVLACEPAGADPARLLDGFEERSRAVAPAARTAYDEPSGWLVTTVGARGEDWGRVILVCGGPPGPADPVLVERAATTLALSRLLADQRDTLEQQAQARLLGAILAGSYPDPEQAALRARALGLPVAGREFHPLVARFGKGAGGLPAQARCNEVTAALAAACRGERVPALVGALDEERAAGVLALPRAAPADRVLAAVCSAARQRLAAGPGGPGRAWPAAGPGGLVIGAGSPAGSMTELRRSLLEARQAADAAAASPPGGAAAPFHRLADLRLRGLLHLLADDPRLATFAERELGPLLAHDRGHGTRLLGVLADFLAEGGNKAAAASRAHLARPTLYQRLRQIERILGVSLESPESRACLHVAMLALAARPDRLPRAAGLGEADPAAAGAGGHPGHHPEPGAGALRQAPKSRPAAPVMRIIAPAAKATLPALRQLPGAPFRIGCAARCGSHQAATSWPAPTPRSRCRCGDPKEPTGRLPSAACRARSGRAFEISSLVPLAPSGGGEYLSNHKVSHRTRLLAGGAGRGQS
jgi:purine catabolism regulator